MKLLLLWVAPSFLFAGNSIVYQNSFEDKGLTVQFRISNLKGDKLTEGEPAQFNFRISDKTTKRGLTGAFPAAWISKKQIIQESPTCIKRISSFVDI